MPKKLDKFDSKKSNKVPIPKSDLEFAIFHAQTLDKIKKDRVNFQKRFFEKVIEELNNSKENNKVGLLKKMIFDNNIENFRLEGLNRLDRKKDIVLENNILRYLIKNYQLIHNEGEGIKDSNTISQTSYFKYYNPHSFDEKLGILYKNLKDEGYINCSKPDFRSVFSESNNSRKVDWIKSQSSFQFFIKQLVAKENIFCKQLWVVSAACFLIDGKEKTNKQLGKVEEPSSNDALLIRECIKDFE